MDVTINRNLQAAPHTVFDAWVNPAVAAQWLFRTAEAVSVRSQIDLIEGGEFLFVEERENERIVTVGEYLAVDPPHRLAFVFSLDQFRTTNAVEVFFDEAAGGGTRLTITHKLDDQWAAFAERTSESWNKMLDALDNELMP